MTSEQKIDWVCSNNYMSSNGEPSNSMHSLQKVHFWTNDFWPYLVSLWPWPLTF